MKVFTLLLFLFSICSYGTGKQESEEGLNILGTAFMNLLAGGAICGEKRDEFFNEEQCKGDMNCLKELSKMREQTESNCETIDNPSFEISDPPELSKSQRNPSAQERNPSSDKQQKGNNTIIKLQPIKL